MKTAFAYWDNRIAPVFDTARQIHVIEVDSEQIVSETQETLSEDLPVLKALRLMELGIGTLVCGAISRQMHGLVAAFGIQVVPFVTGDLREVMQAWINGNLARDAFSMPGCFNRGRRRGRKMNREEYEMKGMGRSGKGKGGGQGQGQGKGQCGQGRGGSPLATGDAGSCLCPKCGQREPHERGAPCVDRKCPKCGAVMIRQ